MIVKSEVWRCTYLHRSQVQLTSPHYERKVKAVIYHIAYTFSPKQSATCRNVMVQIMFMLYNTAM